MKLPHNFEILTAFNMLINVNCGFPRGRIQLQTGIQIPFGGKYPILVQRTFRTQFRKPWYRIKAIQNTTSGLEFVH